MAMSFVFINPLLKIAFSQKQLTKIGYAISSGDQEKLTHITQFPWSPLETGLSISSCFLHVAYDR
jgi:hypothetical protein